MRILHILRAPVGGLFRHVRDLARYQADKGHKVAVLCDSGSSDGLTSARLAELERSLALGLHQTRMARGPSPGDLRASRQALALADRLEIEIIHGHGAKGGAYARLARTLGRRPFKVFYTPHGGSLHYSPRTLVGATYMLLERSLASSTTGIIFESRYSQDVYRRQVGEVVTGQRVIPNGLLPGEFGEHGIQPQAADILFVGELRHLKGVDLLLTAIAKLSKQRPVSAIIVGEGPDALRFRDLARQLGIAEQVTFAGALPAAQAFQKGRCIVVPSRAESFPYIVLEAAARSVPLIAADVGGIGEIVAGTDTTLVRPDDVDALVAAIAPVLADPAAAAKRAARLRERARVAFSVDTMGEAVCAFYDGAPQPLALRDPRPAEPKATAGGAAF